MVGLFPAVVETYLIREPAEEHAELLRKHDLQAMTTPSPEGEAWVVVVSVEEFPQATKLTQAARLTGELRDP